MARRLQINLLGRIETILDGDRLVFKRRKSELLIAYLALQEGYRKDRDTVVGYFCPESPDSLRILKQFALKAFPGNQEAVKYDATSVWLNLEDIDAIVDITRFNRVISDENFDIATALELYQGDLLGGGSDPQVALAFGLNDYKEKLYFALIRAANIEPTKAIALLKQAVAIGPKNWRLYERLAEAYNEAGNKNEALSTLYRLLQVHGSELTEGERRRVNSRRRELESKPQVNSIEALLASTQDGLVKESEPFSLYRQGLASQPSSIEYQDMLGREKDVRLISSYFQESSIVSLIGPPGAGKSTLARAMVLNPEVQSYYRDGAYLVDLQWEKDFLPELCRSLSLSGGAERDDVIGHVSQLNVLIIVDHANHCGEQVISLINSVRTCTRLAHFLLISSRLHDIPAQRVHHLAGLDFPEESADLVPDHRASTLFDKDPAMKLMVRESKWARQEESLDVHWVTAYLGAKMCRRFVGNPQYIKMVMEWYKYGPIRMNMTSEHTPLFELLAAPVRSADGDQSVKDRARKQIAMLSDDERRGLLTISVYRSRLNFNAYNLMEDLLQVRQCKISLVELIRKLIDSGIMSSKGVADGPRRVFIEEPVRAVAEELLLADGDASELYYTMFDFLQKEFQPGVADLVTDHTERQRMLSRIYDGERAFYGLIEWSIEHDLEFALDLYLEGLWHCWMATRDYRELCYDLSFPLNACHNASDRKPPAGKVARLQLCLGITAWWLGPRYTWFKVIEQIDSERLPTRLERNLARLIQFGASKLGFGKAPIDFDLETCLPFRKGQYRRGLAVLVTLDVLFSISAPHRISPALLTSIKSSKSSKPGLKNIAGMFEAWNLIAEEKHQLAISVLQPAFEYFMYEYNRRECARILVVLCKSLVCLRKDADAAKLRGALDVICPRFEAFLGNVFDTESANQEARLLASLEAPSYEMQLAEGRSLDRETAIAWVRSIMADFETKEEKPSGGEPEG